MMSMMTHMDDSQWRQSWIVITFDQLLSVTIDIIRILVESLYNDIIPIIVWIIVRCIFEVKFWLLKL